MTLDLFNLPPAPPHFDGTTYSPQHDGERLGRQLAAVREAMSDGAWRTPAALEAETGYGWASISARLRDLRKDRFGGHEVQRRRTGDPASGLFEYRLIINGEGDERDD